jgi:hypothetical protein
VRPISDLIIDAAKAAGAGVDHMAINRAELRQLKDYELVSGTDNPDVAVFAPLVATIVDGKRVEAPQAFQLHVVETMK